MEIRAKTSIAPKAKRVVSFSSRIRAKRITHVHDYTKEEIRACWYSKKEFLKIKDENEHIVDIMKRKGVVDGEEDSRRGLEGKTRKGIESTRQCRRKALNEVLYEQHLQSQDNNRSEEVIASVYQRQAYQCKVLAYVKGLADEAIAHDLESPLNIKSSTEKSELGSCLVRKRRDRAPVSKQSVLPSAA
jgi:hypothetical protein